MERKASPVRKRFSNGASPFATRVYAIVAKIPRGEVMAYGAVAKKAGNPRAARAVGMLMSRNTDTKKVPCHRVVASDGSLTGYAFGGVSAKRKLLIAEGISFKNSRVDLVHLGRKKCCARLPVLSS